MGDTYLIYGNQSLEIKEKSQEIIQQLLPDDQANEYSVFRFDINDFFSKEKEKNERSLNDLRNTCETVSWLAPRMVVVLDNLQAIPARKASTAKLEKKLEEIRLYRTIHENNEIWKGDNPKNDLDSISDIQITAKQTVREIVPVRPNVFYVRLDQKWEKANIHIDENDDSVSVPFKEFLSDRLSHEIVFDEPPVTVEYQDSASEKLINFLQKAITNPQEEVSLVFTANIQNTRNLNKAIYQLLEKEAKIVKTTVSYDDFRPVSWITDRARKKNLQINSSLADLMIEICGSNLSVLNGELDKLALLYPPETKIMASDLIRNVSHSKKFSIFRVADFLVRKDTKNALESLEAILRDHPADAISIFGIVSSQFRRLLKVCWMLDQGTPEKHIVKNLKLNPWIGQQIIKQCRRYSCRELENIVVYLSKQDLAVKYHAKEAMVILEQICYQICLGELSNPTPIRRRWVPGA